MQSSGLSVIVAALLLGIAIMAAGVAIGDRAPDASMFAIMGMVLYGVILLVLGVLALVAPRRRT